MRLRRLELAVIALTLAFICFMGGYFTGRRGAVNIVTVAPRQSEAREAAGVVPQNAGDSAVLQQTGGDEAYGSDAVAPGDYDGYADTGTARPNDPVGAPRAGDGRININLASHSELMDLPGIGSVLATRIIDYKRQHGDYSAVEELRNVSGIGEKRYEAIRDLVTVG